MAKKTTYRNFNGLVSADPAFLLEPKDLEELRQAVREHKKIRVAGDRHVFNDLSVSLDTMILTHKLNRIEIDQARKLVTIESGVKLKELLQRLDGENLTLETVPATSCLSVVGAIGTSAHGSRCNFGSISSALKAAELVLADGALLKVTNGNLLRAVRCHLGCLGVIYKATLRCVPAFDVRVTTRSMSWEEFASNFNPILCRYPWTSASVNQYSPSLDTKVRIARKVPKGQGNTKLTGCGKSWYIEIELCFDVKQLKEAVYAVANFQQEYFRQHRLRLDQGLFIRFSGPDDSLLSMASGRATAYVSSISSDRSRDPKAVYHFMRALSNAMVRQYKARPHYGKINHLDHSQMESLYDKQYSRFKEIRHQLDPGRKFCNPHLDKFL